MNISLKLRNLGKFMPIGTRDPINKLAESVIGCTKLKILTNLFKIASKN